MGPQGLEGPAGSEGPAGPSGLSCWDLDGDGVCTRDTEDRDADGRCDVRDCRGPVGELGQPGAAGTACWDVDGSGQCNPAEDLDGDGDCTTSDCRGPTGAPGPVGPTGIACWDLDADGACELAVEDANADGACDADDCRGPVGPPGPQGLACWDVDGDGACGPAEDVDGNGFCGPVDCAAVIQAGPGLTRTGNSFQAAFPASGSFVGTGSLVARADHGHNVNALFDAMMVPQLGVTVPAPRVDPQGGFVARGQLGYGYPPAQGEGVRMMWYPFKAAFRAGGVSSTAWDDASVGFYSLASGYETIASGNYSVALGDGTSATQHGAFAAGVGSQASGTASSAAGYSSQALGHSAVALGYRATAAGDYSVALGYRAATGPRADGTACPAGARDGAFVFADSSSTDFFCATAPNEFAIRAAGGVRLRTNVLGTTGCNLGAGSGTWSCTSSLAEKEGFEPVDGDALLDRIAALYVSTWRYRSEAGAVRHIGPVAQDFHAAFDVGASEEAIDLVDADGVNLAAIQALEARTRVLAARADEADRLAARVAELEAERDRLEARLRRLEALLPR